MDTVFSVIFSQVMGRANCLAAAGDYIFIGLSTGLSVFSMPQREKLFSWEAVKLEVCAVRTTDLGNGSHLLGSVDELGKYSGFCLNICIVYAAQLICKVHSGMLSQRPRFDG